MKKFFLSSLLFLLLFINSSKGDVCKGSFIEIYPIQIEHEIKFLEGAKLIQLNLSIKNNLNVPLEIGIKNKTNIFQLTIVPTVTTIGKKESKNFLILINLSNNSLKQKYYLPFQIALSKLMRPEDFYLILEIDDGKIKPYLSMDSLLVATIQLPEFLITKISTYTTFTLCIFNKRLDNLSNLSLKINSDFETIVTPSVIDEILPMEEEGSFNIDIFIPSQTNPGKYFLSLELNSEELTISNLSITLLVLKNKNGKDSFLILLFLFLVFLLIFKKFQYYIS